MQTTLTRRPRSSPARPGRWAWGGGDDAAGQGSPGGAGPGGTRQEPGADLLGGENLAKRVEEGFTDFDVAIATPDMMPLVGRLGRILGPSGKMTNPKVGTVTTDVRKAVEESKSGKVEYRTDRTAIVHLVIGKRSFEDRALLENYAAVIEEIIRAKPSVAKGRYLRSIVMASTQGPGIKVDPTRTRDIVEEAHAAAAAAA